MARRWKANRRRWKVAFILVGLCLLIFLFMFVRYMQFNDWLYSDAKKLGPYPTVLIRDGKPLEDAVDGPDREASINRALIESNSKERLVVHLSRSEIRYSALHQRAYVKVFLETSLPGEPDRVQRIKFLNILGRRDDTWYVLPDGLVQLTLP